MRTLAAIKYPGKKTKLRYASNTCWLTVDGRPETLRIWKGLVPSQLPAGEPRSAKYNVLPRRKWIKRKVGTLIAGLHCIDPDRAFILEGPNFKGCRALFDHAGVTNIHFQFRGLRRRKRSLPFYMKSARQRHLWKCAAFMLSDQTGGFREKHICIVWEVLW